MSLTFWNFFQNGNSCTWLHYNMANVDIVQHLNYPEIGGIGIPEIPKKPKIPMFRK